VQIDGTAIDDAAQQKVAAHDHFSLERDSRHEECEPIAVA
jgi:hypothetical protein